MAESNRFTRGQYRLPTVLTGDTNFLLWKERLFLYLQNEEINDPDTLYHTWLTVPPQQENANLLDSYL